MKPFEKGELTLPPPKEFIARHMEVHKVTRREAKEQYNRLMADEIWCNDLYQVNINRKPAHNFPFELTHLSIKRRDKAPIHDWRHLQQIKNMLCGPGCEAIEIYPMENRLADLANQFHLWVFEEGYHVPCGFGNRDVRSDSFDGAIQRPYEDGDTTLCDCGNIAVGVDVDQLPRCWDCWSSDIRRAT